MTTLALAFVSCFIVSNEAGVVTLTCNEGAVLLDIPTVLWPVRWEGEKSVGTAYPAIIEEGKYRSFGSEKYCARKRAEAVESLCRHNYCGPPANIYLTGCTLSGD